MSDAAAVHFDGASLALCDGPELLVYNQDGTPRWKVFCDQMLVEVRCTAGAILALDVDGRLLRYRPHDGMVLEHVEVEGGGAGLDATADGIALVRTSTDLVLVEGTATLALNQGATSAAAFGAERTKLGVGWPDGTFRAFDQATGQPPGEQKLGTAVTHVAWSVRGSWVVLAGPQLFLISANGRQIEATIALQGPPRHLSCGPGGVFAGVVMGGHQVAVADLHAGKLQGTIDFRREVCGTSWGSMGQLVVGLDDADATVLDVFSGGSVRTEPHPGRGRNTWNYEDHLERDALRGSAAYARAGTSVLAKYEGPPDDRWPWWQTCLVVVLVSTVLCGGCTGCGGLLYYLRSIGVF